MTTHRGSSKWPYSPEELQAQVKYLIVLYRATDGEILSWAVSTRPVGGICPGPKENPGSYGIAYYELPEGLRNGDIISSLHKAGKMKIDPATAMLKLGNYVLKPFKHPPPEEAVKYCRPA